MTPIRVELADDHTLLRQGVRRLLEDHPEFVVIAEASSGLESVHLAREHQPDIAVLDIGMPELNGIEAAAQIRRHSPGTAVVILSMHHDERYVLRALDAGARGYLLKDAVEGELVEALRRIEQGGSFFSPAIAAMLNDGHIRRLRAEGVKDGYDLLTERERLVYQLLAEGHSNKSIAARLCLSLHTVETHRTRLMEKLDIHNAAELVLSAVRRGVIR